MIYVRNLGQKEANEDGMSSFSVCSLCKNSVNFQRSYNFMITSGSVSSLDQLLVYIPLTQTGISNSR